MFLNVPFDEPYEPLFVALIAGLTSLGQTPRCVLEIAETGEGRLKRIIDLLRRCPASIHDVSRVETSLVNGRRVPRFNMPFELGLAMMLPELQAHDVHVFESTPHRLGWTLSDLGGIDPMIHGNDPTTILRRLLGAFARVDRQPTLAELQTVRSELSRAAQRYKRDRESDDIFDADAFQVLTTAAAASAADLGLIAR